MPGISHSSKKYTIKNIAESRSEYEAFITGSDRVWSTSGKCGAADPSYFLDFAEGRKRIAYSASATNENLTKVEEEFYKDSLRAFDFIAVREKSLAVMLRALMPEKRIVHTLDPVFLLDAEEWRSLYPTERKEEGYAFVYLLDPVSVSFDSIRRYAQRRGLRIMYIPYAKGVWNAYDKAFGDIRLSDTGPREFVQCIDHADTVITDSFHCAAFSLLFERELFVLERDQLKGLATYASRITSLFECFDIAQSRRINIGCEIPVDEKMIDYDKTHILMDGMRNSSKEYLKEALRQNESET